MAIGSQIKGCRRGELEVASSEVAVSEKAQRLLVLVQLSRSLLILASWLLAETEP